MQSDHFLYKSVLFNHSRENIRGQQNIKWLTGDCQLGGRGQQLILLPAMSCDFD